eukprot:936508-Rhodomonas_salina.1
MHHVPPSDRNRHSCWKGQSSRFSAWVDAVSWKTDLLLFLLFMCLFWGKLMQLGLPTTSA